MTEAISRDRGLNTQNNYARPRRGLRISLQIPLLFHFEDGHCKAEEKLKKNGLVRGTNEMGVRLFAARSENEGAEFLCEPREQIQRNLLYSVAPGFRRIGVDFDQ